MQECIVFVVKNQNTKKQLIYCLGTDENKLYANSTVGLSYHQKDVCCKCSKRNCPKNRRVTIFHFFMSDICKVNNNHGENKRGQK